MQATLGSDTTLLNFILDTGSGGISLDSTTCLDLHLQPTPSDTTIMGIAGSHKVSYLFNQKLTTGALITDSLNFYINDYSLLTSTYGAKIDGIIGYSFLKKYIFKINFDSARIQIFKPGLIAYETGGTIFYPSFNRLLTHELTVKDKIKIKGNFYFDTGAGLSLLLTDEFVAENNILLNRRRPVVTQVQGLGGKKKMRLTVVKKLSVGPYTFRNVPTNLYNDETKVIAYPYSCGLLGNDILRRFNVTLNYPQKQIYLKPNNSYNDDFDYAYTGLTLYNFEDKIVIDDVIKDSPAEKGGFKNGDEVVCVGANCSGIIKKYENLLQKTNESIRLILMRNGKLLFLDISPVSIR